MKHYELWIDGSFVIAFYSLVTIVVYAYEHDIDVDFDKVCIKTVEGEI